MASHLKLLLFALVAAVCIASVAGLKCRVGSASEAKGGKTAGVAVAISPSEKTCTNTMGKTEFACFRSVACTSVNGKITTKFTEWACIDKTECKNVTNGKGSATHDLIKGVCCLTDNCNIDKANKCTQGNAATNLASIIAVSFGLLVTYMMSWE